MKPSSRQSPGKKREDAPAAPRRILLVDDHAVVRRGLAQIIDMEPDLHVVGEASTAAEALNVLGFSDAADAAVIDITLESGDGIELIKGLRAQGCRIPLLVLSMHDESLYAERSLRAGAQGYVMKHEMPDVIVDALRRILSGGIHVSSDLSSRLLGRLVSRSSAQPQSPNYGRLSDRELQVFEGIGRGHGTSDLAHRLGLSVKTIETYRAHIKQKLGLRTALDLVRHALRWVESDGGPAPAKEKPRRR